MVRFDDYLGDLCRLSVPSENFADLFLELVVGDVKASASQVSDKKLNKLTLAPTRRLMGPTMRNVMKATVPKTATII